MRFVTFEIAKILKELGYNKFSNAFYTTDGKLHSSSCRDWEIKTFLCFAPTYIEVWLWLWRNKDLRFSINYNKISDTECECWITVNQKHIPTLENTNDPEAAIIEGVKYVINNLLCQQNNI